MKERRYTAGNSMTDLIRDNPMLLPAVSRFGMAFGFGDLPVRTVCRNNGVDENTFLCVCNLLSGYSHDPASIDLATLMSYLKRAHASFLDIELPKIRHYLLDAVNFNGTDEVSLLLMKFYDDYVLEAKKHMEYENDVIFAYAARLLEGETDEDFTISRYSSSHGDTVARLNELKDIFIYHYGQKDNARLGGVLLDIIICGRDLLAHFDVESRLFIPAVEKLEAELMSSVRNPPAADESGTGDAPGALALLSDREKEILRRVALGRANKEIADELCISVHTVATHRRNIGNKLEIHTTAGIIIFAVIHHLVNLDEVKPM